jgi:exopolyphosphatase/guanosine-5'-triphosphate,3'-diphosphate pyrophosphatase
LLVVEDGVARVDRSVITKLGQGVGETGRLHPDAIARTLHALRQHVAEARGLGAQPFATGTSALRDAANRDDFLLPAREVLGSDVRILSGEEEAVRTFRGALLGLPGISGRCTVVDIGGGSTEIVVGAGRSIESKVSHQIGAVRLAERFLRSDPPAPTEIDALRAAVRRVLSANPIQALPLVAVAGTATTLAAVDLGLDPYDGARVHGHSIERARLEEILDRLLTCKTADRARIRGVEPGRAEVLPAGASILAEVVDRAGAPRVTVSDRGLRWGVLIDP